MAMTKKERAEMDATIFELGRVAALRWTQPVEPDVPVPKWLDRSRGWLPAYDRVELAWSSSVSHGRGEWREHGSGSQGARALYSTPTLALRALRYAIEHEAAIKLMKIDRMIRESQEAPHTPQEAK